MLGPVNFQKLMDKCRLCQSMPSFFLNAAKPFYDVLRVSPLVYVQNGPKFCVYFVQY